MAPVFEENIFNVERFVSRGKSSRNAARLHFPALPKPLAQFQAAQKIPISQKIIIIEITSLSRCTLQVCDCMFNGYRMYKRLPVGSCVSSGLLHKSVILSPVFALCIPKAMKSSLPLRTALSKQDGSRKHRVIRALSTAASS